MEDASSQLAVLRYQPEGEIGGSRSLVMTNQEPLSPGPVRVLLLEDDDFDLLSFRRMIARSRKTIELEHHSSLLDAEYSSTADQADVVIADMNLLDSRGLETFLRCRERWPDKPTIVLSGVGSEQVAQECVRLGAQDYLVKGEIESKSLLRSIRYAMERHRASKDREALVSRLEESRRLEAMGQLAEGVAHEINTPTQFVSDNCTFVKAALTEVLGALSNIRRLASGGATPAEQEITKVVSALDLEYLNSEIPFALTESLGGLSHIQRIVQAMREFAYPEAEQPVSADLNRAIEMSVVVATSEWKHVATIEKNFEEDLPWVECLPGSIKQVLLNLFVNASHAVAATVDSNAGEKGKIQIQTRQLDESLVEIRITDNGCGIPSENLSRVKNPSFTTKPLGRGTGQGLAIAERMITVDHKGSLEIESTVGKGTTVIVRLPIKAETDSLQRA